MDYRFLAGGVRVPREDARWPALVAYQPVGVLPTRAYATLSAPQYQSMASACMAHGIAGMLESEARARTGAKVDLNRLDLYFGARWLEGNGAETRDNGSYPDKMAEWALRYGTVLEDRKPYDPRIVTTWRPPAEWAEERRMLTAAVLQMPRSVDQIRAEIAANRAVTVCHFVYQQMTSEARTTGVEGGPTNPSNSLGGHARCIVGYDDDLASFWVWNWWRGWGVAHPLAGTDSRFAPFRDSFSRVPYAMAVDPDWSFFFQRVGIGLKVEV